MTKIGRSFIDGQGAKRIADNILNFRELVNYSSVDLITADGGFDFSIDFNNQEQLAYRLIFCELITAISVQAVGGCQVIKIFDIYLKFHIFMLFLILHYHFFLHLGIQYYSYRNLALINQLIFLPLNWI